MKQILAKILVAASAGTMVLSTLMMARQVEPFHSIYFLFAWWSYIGMADGWLYLTGGDSLFIGNIAEFITFLVPLSAVLWFLFEAFNLRLNNWHYVGVHPDVWIRWPGYFLAFGTVLPGIFLTANLLDHLGILRKNEFSQFFAEAPSKRFMWMNIAGGLAMMSLSLLIPRYCFPLVWGGMVLLLDPINAAWGGRSLLQEWRQGNWTRTFQLLLAGAVCGGLWELWNFWAGAKWVYSVPLPDWLLRDLKIFEMPLLGVLGFPPFALECFVVAESARLAKARLSRAAWKLCAAAALIFSLAMCRQIDLHTVSSYRANSDRVSSFR